MKRKKHIDINKMAMLGERMAIIRKSQGKTSLALAEECNLNPNIISRIERGQGNPRLSTLLVISEALSITVSELLNGI